MEQQHFLVNGLATDTDPQYQPEGTYRYAQNWFLNAGNHLEQERSGEVLPFSNLPLVGVVALNGQEILFSTDGTVSEIGVLDNDTYSTVLNSSSFSLGYPVRGTARIDYRGHRLVYWGDGESMRWLDLDAPVPPLPDGLNLVAAPTSPVVKLGSVQAGGSLPTGVYQATATLVTASKNEVGYGLFTGVIPIVNEDPNTAARQQLDGAPPQTAASGSITFNLSNLDPSYTYVKLVVATYTGIANQLELHSLPLISLNKRTSLSYTYYAFSQHEEDVTLGAIVAEVPNYVSAAEVMQKDGHLLLANVKTAAEESINWQQIANNIKLGPAIKEVPFSEAVHVTHLQEGTNNGGVEDAPLSYDKQDYKNPALTETGKGFMRNEVYSFCFIPIVNGRKLDAYHIPAPALPTPGTFEAYYSQESYPANQGYPTDNFSVRHHRMPRLVEEPLLGNGTLRILGVKEVVKPDLSSLTDKQRESFTGYLIGMQQRTGANRAS